MDGSNEVSMVEPNGVRDPFPPESSGYVLGGSAFTGVALELSEARVDEEGDMVHQQPQTHTTRTRIQSAACSGINPPDEVRRGGYSRMMGW